MKIRKDIDLDILKNYGYKYENNLVYPSYKKVVQYGNAIIIINIYVQNRIIAINQSKVINKKNINYIRDLLINDLVEK